MPLKFNSRLDALRLRAELEAHNYDFGLPTCWIFQGLSIYVDRSQRASTDILNGEAAGPVTVLDLRLQMASNTAGFAAARLVEDLKDENITHVVVGDNRSRLRSIRETISR